MRLVRPKNVDLLAWVVQNSVLIDTGYSTPCRVWQGPTDNGYGIVCYRGKHVKCHIVTFGPVPDGLVRDHLCRTRACNEPSHIRAVTRRTNVLENSEGVTAQHARKTSCKHGHPFDEANTVYRPGGGRDCRACMVARWTASNERRRLAKLNAA